MNALSMIERSRARCALALLLCATLAGAPRVIGQDRPTGSVAFENSGSEAAQAPFLRGLAALHSFWYPEAADAFLEAQRADPGFAMAYWGEAMTYSHLLWGTEDIAAARAALAKLAATPEERIALAPTAREKAYLEAVELLYGEGTTVARQTAWVEAMKRIASEYPDDVDAAALFALGLQTNTLPGALGVQSRMRSAAVLERLFAVRDRHPGVLHYLIHAYDDPIHASLGLRPALLYAETAPAAPHALHMPSHIFLQLGLWHRVAASNEDAYAASLAWVRRRQLPKSHRDFHSLSWLQYAYLQLGRVGEALECLRLAQAAAEETGDPGVTDIARTMTGRYLLETDNDLPSPWVEDLRRGRPDLGLFVLGSEAHAAGAAEAAASYRDQLGEYLATLGDVHPERRLWVETWERLVAARAAAAAGDREAAVAAAEEAVETEARGQLPNGPPAGVPASEVLGELLLDFDQPDRAARAFEDALYRTPNRARSVLGLARALQRSGQVAAARDRYLQLAEMWEGADAGLPVLAEVREALR